MVRENQNAVNIFIDEAKGFVEIKSYANRIGGEPLEIALDFRDVVLDDDLADLSR